MGEVLLQTNHRKTFRFIFVLLVGLGLGLFSSNTAVASQPNTPWSLIGFTSIYTPDRLKDIFTNRHSYQDSYLVALALNHRFARPNRSLGWEWEVQGVRHFGRQNHFETNALILARWYRFPWNDRVATTFAVGEGLSYVAAPILSGWGSATAFDSRSIRFKLKPSFLCLYFHGRVASWRMRFCL